jgi:hypothetical protein
VYGCRVRGHDERLSRQPSSPEEFVAHAALIAEVEAARPAMDKEYDHVSGTLGGGGVGGGHLLILQSMGAHASKQLPLQMYHQTLVSLLPVCVPHTKQLPMAAAIWDDESVWRADPQPYGPGLAFLPASKYTAHQIELSAVSAHIITTTHHAPPLSHPPPPARSLASMSCWRSLTYAPQQRSWLQPPAWAQTTPHCAALPGRLRQPRTDMQRPSGEASSSNHACKAHL